MAATLSTQKPLDIRKSASSSIRIGDSVQTAAASGLTSLRFNHKPTVSSVESAVSTIQNQKENGQTKFTLRDGDDTYDYEGQTGDSDCTLVLLPDESGDGFVLESLETALVYNLTRAPWEQDPVKLAKQYTILPAIDAMRAQKDGEHSDDTEEDEEADPDNPFDYRHHLSTTSPNVGPVAVNRISTSTVNSPTLSHAGSHAQSSNNTPIARPARKPANPMMPRKTKPRPSAPVGASPTGRPKPAPTALALPEVRISASRTTRKTQKPAVEDIVMDDIGDDRNESERDDDDDDDDDDDGGLVFDNSPTKKPTAMRNGHNHGPGLGLSQGGAPMSLRSAASSPGSRVSSPAPMSFRSCQAQRHHHHNATAAAADEDDDEDEADGNDDGNDQLMLDVDDDDDEDRGKVQIEDDDVDHLHLGSPARHQPEAQQRSSHHRPDTTATATTRRRSSAHGQHQKAEEDGGDEDDELELEMLRAMAEDEDEEPRATVAVEDEEESEEE